MPTLQACRCDIEAFNGSDSSRSDKCWRIVEGLGSAMPGEGRDCLDFPALPGKVGEAQAPSGVGGEPRHTRSQGDAADHL